MQNVSKGISDVTGNVGRGLSDVTGTVGEALSDTGIIQTVRRNPLPFALIGLGLGVLAMQSRRRSSTGYSASYRSHNKGEDYGNRDNDRDNRSSAVSSTLRSASRTVKGAASSAYEGVSNAGGALSNADVVGTVRRNPLPFALMGLSIGMLAMQNRRSSSSTPSYSYDYEAGNYTEGEYDASGGRRGGRSTLKSAGKSVGNVANTAYSGVSGAANSAYQGLTSVAGSAYEGVGTVGTQAKQVAGKAQDQYEYYIEENPLAVGAVALALGAAVGFMIPATQTESQLMGEYRDNLMQKAGDAARGALDKVQQVAGEMANSVREEAQNQGLVQ